MSVALKAKDKEEKNRQERKKKKETLSDLLMTNKNLSKLPLTSIKSH